MNNLKLYRRRYIPDEIVYLKDDEIISYNDERIITKWNVLKKRNDFSHGASCYFLKDNIKLSKFIDKNNNILYWYCDIIDYTFNKEENTYIFNDLLIDIIIYEDGFVKVVDLAEVSEAIDKNLIDINLAKKALCIADKLLNIIYKNEFSELQKYIINV